MWFFQDTGHFQADPLSGRRYNGTDHRDNLCGDLRKNRVSCDFRNLIVAGAGDNLDSHF